MSNAMQVREMISTHPDVQGRTADKLLRCIEECCSCAQTCTACADACLAESTVDKMRQCIRLNLDCADICAATGVVASRRTGSNVEVLRAAIQACAKACQECGQECERHAGEHEHCRIAPSPASAVQRHVRPLSKRFADPRSTAGGAVVFAAGGNRVVHRMTGVTPARHRFSRIVMPAGNC
jgi:hypothetical protein